MVAAVRGDLNFRYLYASGGMPSVHSAVVTALATTALILSGGGSSIFGVTAVVAAIVIYDSLGMRRAVGEQAVALNMVISSLNSGKVWVQKPETKLNEVLGHRPFEVVVGGVMGIVLAGLFNYDKIGNVTDFMQATPRVREVVAYAAVFAVILVVGIAQRFVMKRRYRKSRTVKSLANRIMWASVTVAVIGGVLAGLQFEKASYAGWRVWTITVLVLAAFWAYSIFEYARDHVSKGLADETAAAKKSRWLPGSKKKKR
jgi:acid phosphatase family membrane protein YuiD